MPAIHAALAFVLLVIVTAQPAIADDYAIAWCIPYDAPLHTEAKDGPVDKMQAYFANRCTNIEHSVKYVSMGRSLDDAAHGLDMCIPYLRKTPAREEMLLFSDTVVLTPGLRLFMLKSSRLAQEFSQSPASLKAILESGDYRYNTRKGRSFGPTIDALFAEYAEGRQMMVDPGVSETVTMLESERIDFIVDYAFIIEFHLNQTGKHLDLEVLALQEDPGGRPAYIGCSKTPAGREAVRQINEIIKKYKGTESYRAMAISASSGTSRVDRLDAERRYKLLLRQ